MYRVQVEESSKVQTVARSRIWEKLGKYEKKIQPKPTQSTGRGAWQGVERWVARSGINRRVGIRAELNLSQPCPSHWTSRDGFSTGAHFHSHQQTADLPDIYLLPHLSLKVTIYWSPCCPTICPKTRTLYAPELATWYARHQDTWAVAPDTGHQTLQLGTWAPELGTYIDVSLAARQQSVVFY